MTTPQIIVIIGVTSIIAAFIGAITANLKNRSSDAWGFACFIFPPALLLLFLLPRGSHDTRRRKISKRDLDDDIRDDMF